MSNKPTSDGQERQPETKKAPIGSVEPIFCEITAQLEALGYYTQSDRTKPRKMMSAILHGLDAAYWVGVEDATKLQKENAEMKAMIQSASEQGKEEE